MLERIIQFIARKFPNAQRRAYRHLKQTWKDADGDHTLRLRYPLTKESVVVDVGGYRGQWTSDIYAMYRCHVHVFEPIPKFADVITRRFADNPDITLHRVALGVRDGTALFEDADDSSGRFATTGLRGSQTPVPVRAAASYFAGHGIGHIDLMKLNIEGDEYDLLEHLASSGAIRNIDHIQVQFHPFFPDADERLRRSHELLSKTHRPAYQYRYIWESWMKK